MLPGDPDTYKIAVHSIKNFVFWKVIMLSQLKSYLFGADDGGLMQEPAVGDCANNGGAEDDWVLVDTQGKI